MVCIFITVLKENINYVFIIETWLLRNKYYISIQNMHILHKTFCEWSIMYDSLIVALDDISYYKTIFCRWRPAHLFVGIGNFILEDKMRLLIPRWCQGVLWPKEKNIYVTFFVSNVHTLDHMKWKMTLNTIKEICYKDLNTKQYIIKWPSMVYDKSIRNFFNL